MREVEPTNSDPLIFRVHNKRDYEHPLSPEQELTKYGYRAKPLLTVGHRLLAFACLTIAVTVHAYIMALYKVTI